MPARPNAYSPCPIECGGRSSTGDSAASPLNSTVGIFPRGTRSVAGGSVTLGLVLKIRRSETFTRVSSDSGAFRIPCCPSNWDWRRLSAELVATSAVRIGSIFRQSASKALRTGQVVVFPLGDRDVQLRVRVLDDGQAYIAIGFRTVIETDFMVLALGSMPGVKAEDWQVEPTSPLHLPLEPGEVIWSTLLSREALAWLLEVDES